MPVKYLTLGLLLISAACVAPEQGDSIRPYDSDMCIVMDSKLGSMGDPIVLIHEGQELKFCCKPCVKEFKDDPELYLGKLAEK